MWVFRHQWNRPILSQVFNLPTVLDPKSENNSLLALVFSAGIQMVNSDWQNLRRFHFPWKSGCIVCLSGLKGRISAGDYREETIGKANGDFVSWVLSLYVFMVFEVHHSCQVCLDQPLQLHLFPMRERVKVRKVYAHFLLLRVYTV